VLYVVSKTDAHLCYRTGLPGVIPGFPSSGNAAIVKVFFWTPQGERTPALSSDLSPASTLIRVNVHSGRRDWLYHLRPLSHDRDAEEMVVTEFDGPGMAQ
jgi:hypothetical protein